MKSYLIEFRFFGKAKREMRELIYEINRRFRIGGRKAIPHVSLAGPFTTNFERRLINDFSGVCSQTPVMKFKVRGFDNFHENRVVYVHIDPTEQLDEFRWNLSKTLQPYCKLRPHDYEKKFYYHATLAMKLDRAKFNQIKAYVDKKMKPDYKHILLRVTLLRYGKILYEYDFLQRRLLNRRQALNREIYHRTRNLLNQYFSGAHDPNKNIGATQPPRKSFFEKIMSIFK